MPYGLNIFLIRLILAVFLIESTYGCMSKTYVNCGSDMCRRACNGGISQPDEQTLARDVGGCNCGCGMRDDIASWMPQFGYPGCRMGFCNSGQRFSPSYSSIFLTLLLLALAHI